MLERAAQRAEEEAARARAEVLLARRRARARAKELALTLAIAEERKRTEVFLRAQAEALDRLKRDAMLDALLAARRAGKPIAEALAEVERRFPPRAAEKLCSPKPCDEGVSGHP